MPDRSSLGHTELRPEQVEQTGQISNALDINPIRATAGTLGLCSLFLLRQVVFQLPFRFVGKVDSLNSSGVLPDENLGEFGQIARLRRANA